MLSYCTPDKHSPERKMNETKTLLTTPARKSLHYTNVHKTSFKGLDNETWQKNLKHCNDKMILQEKN